MVKKNYLTTTELAELLQVHPVTILEMIRRGEVKAYRFRKRGWWRIPKDEVDKLLKKLERGEEK